MPLRDLFKMSAPSTPDLPDKEDDFIKGKIYLLNREKGYGFIETEAIPFTRIFFHWSDLRHDTVHFTKLHKGMVCYFKPLYREDKQSHRATKIRVVPDGD